MQNHPSAPVIPNYCILSKKCRYGMSIALDRFYICFV